MNPVYIYGLAAQHTRWATVRQAVITGNIANANTGGYSAQEIEPFSAVMDNPSGFAMATTSANDIGAAQDGTDIDGSRTWKVSDTGAPVALDQEMVKADDVSRSFSLDTSIVKAFHRMILESVKSGT